jgi:hypothetical protein
MPECLLLEVAQALLVADVLLLGGLLLPRPLRLILLPLVLPEELLAVGHGCWHLLLVGARVRVEALALDLVDALVGVRRKVLPGPPDDLVQVAHPVLAHNCGPKKNLRR